MTREGLGSAHTRIMDLGDRKELSPSANLTLISVLGQWDPSFFRGCGKLIQQHLLFPGVWQAYPVTLKLACAGAGSSLLMCCFGDLAKVASNNRKGGLMLSYPENDLGNSLTEVRGIRPWC